jgi:hypothetical protein
LSDEIARGGPRLVDRSPIRSQNAQLGLAFVLTELNGEAATAPFAVSAHGDGVSPSASADGHIKMVAGFDLAVIVYDNVLERSVLARSASHEDVVEVDISVAA